MSSTKALSRTESDQIRRHLRALVMKFEGNQTEAARAVGVSQQAVNSVLRGNDAGMYVAKKVAAALGMTLDQALAVTMPTLDALIGARENEGRWHTATVSAVRAMPIGALSVATLEKLLDDTDRHIRASIASLSPRSRR